MARTQAVYYRDDRGVEPVDVFIERLPPKRAAKVDAYVEEHLNGKAPGAAPPPFPISSQIEGELRELRVRFANTRYRILYQRSVARRRMDDFKHRMSARPRMPPRAAGRDAPGSTATLSWFIYLDKLRAMRGTEPRTPVGARASDASRSRVHRSEAYREARDEYTAIRTLRERNWIAAHIRERRFELELTQREVAERAQTSHSFIARLERGDHIPTIPVLKRILAVLDEELLIGIERRRPGEEPERELAPAPDLAVA